MNDPDQITGRQIAAARVLAGLGQIGLAELAGISVPTLERMEATAGAVGELPNDIRAVRSALKSAGVVFLRAGECAAGIGLSLKQATASSIDTDVSATVQYPEFEEGDGGPGSGG
jgi:hypothetical protein